MFAAEVLGDFEGGGLWVQDCAGDKPRRAGDDFLLGKKGRILFDPLVAHALDRWSGDRTVLVAYSPAGAGPSCALALVCSCRSSRHLL